MVDDRRAACVGDGDERRERHHLAGGVSDLEPADVLAPHAVVAVGLNEHRPVAAKGGPVVDVGTAEIDLQRRIDLRQVDPLRLDLLPIDVDEELRLVGPETGEQPRQPRLCGGRID